MTTLRLLAIAASVTVLDQLSKWYVWTHFQLGESRTAIPGVFDWTYCHNTGGAFSIFPGSRWFFLLAGTVISAYLAYSLPRVSKGPWPSALAYALILGGAIGNLIDRSLYGYVVDFIDFKWWPVFNLADSGITVGIAILAVTMLFEKEPDQTPK